MRRLVSINRCQDCPQEDCKLRQMCGCIPDECELPVADEGLTTQRHGEAEEQRIGTEKYEKPVFELLRYGGGE